MATVAELLQPVEADLDALLADLRSLIGAGHPILQAAAEHLFAAGGKRLRPGIVLLISRAIAPDGDLGPRHRRLAEITEMIHTASLVHDDVVDGAATRRGVDTVHSRFNHRVAVLAGDFLFAQASWHLANLDDLEVVKLLSRVIMDLADGEVKQGLFRYDTGQSFETYLEKSYCKTASLIANSARAAGVLTGLAAQQLDDLYRFGRQLGLAFQVVDDILDFTGSDQQLGKPADRIRRILASGATNCSDACREFSDPCGAQFWRNLRGEAELVERVQAGRGVLCGEDPLDLRADPLTRERGDERGVTAYRSRCR